MNDENGTKQEVAGTFGVYQIKSDVIKCHIGCADIAFDKQQFEDFISELQEMGGKMR